MLRRNGSFLLVTILLLAPGCFRPECPPSPQDARMEVWFPVRADAAWLESVLDSEGWELLRHGGEIEVTAQRTREDGTRLAANFTLVREPNGFTHLDLRAPGREVMTQDETRELLAQEADRLVALLRPALGEPTRVDTHGGRLQCEDF